MELKDDKGVVLKMPEGGVWRDGVTVPKSDAHYPGVGEVKVGEYVVMWNGTCETFSSKSFADPKLAMEDALKNLCHHNAVDLNPWGEPNQVVKVEELKVLRVVSDQKYLDAAQEIKKSREETKGQDKKNAYKNVPKSRDHGIER